MKKEREVFLPSRSESYFSRNVLWTETSPKIVERSCGSCLKFTRCKCDPCLYLRLQQDGKGNLSFAIIANYFDNLILTSISSNLLELVQQEVMAKNKMTDLGDLSWCLGIKVTQGEDTILLSQSNMFQGFWKELVLKIANKSRLRFSGRSAKWYWKASYQSLMGLLMWAMIGTRPDIAFAIGAVSKFVSKPCRKHVIAAKRVIRYLKFNKDYDLRFI